MGLEEYMQFVLVFAWWITLAAVWVLLMMVARSIIRHRRGEPPTGGDIAAMTYVLGTILVFAIIGLRYGNQVSREVVLFILALKALSITGIGFWISTKMRRELL